MKRYDLDTINYVDVYGRTYPQAILFNDRTYRVKKLFKVWKEETNTSGLCYKFHVLVGKKQQILCLDPEDDSTFFIETEKLYPDGLRGS